MPATQEDVAAHAGVARKTVSNVINGYPHISAGVRRRVLAAIEELDYRPNHFARSLRSGRSRIIGLVIPELDVSYFAELARLVVIEANRRDMNVTIMQTLSDRGRELDAVSGASMPFVEGLIYSPAALSSQEISDNCGPAPLILLGERAASDGVMDHVGIDNVAAARDATRHLMAVGCRRIAFLGASDHPGLAQMRLRGYNAALAESRIVRNEAGFVQQVEGYHREHGLEAMQRLLANVNLPPDGIFCATDLLAQGAVRALWDAGLRVPEDVAVVGFDGTDEGHYSLPSLTSIAPDKNEIAHVAVARLVDRLDGHVTGVEDTKTSYVLQVRESSIGWTGGVNPRPRRTPASNR